MLAEQPVRTWPVCGHRPAISIAGLTWHTIVIAERSAYQQRSALRDERIVVSLKDEVKELLDTKEFEAIAKLAKDKQRVVRYLFSFLYSTDDLLHWRAAEALGIVASLQASGSVDEGRNIARRLIWSLAEESGATAWPAPEALGAVVSSRISLFPDLAPIVLSFIEDPILCRGVLWSARKIGEKRPDLIEHSIPDIIRLLRADDATIRGHAAWALGAMHAKEAREALAALQNDSDPLYVYDAGELVKTTVGELASASLAEITRS